MNQQDLYTILGVSKGAAADEIKKAYRELAKRYHPDRNPDDTAAEERFKEISAAFAVLGDEKKRALYDEFGPDGLREGFDAEAARNYQRWAGQGRRGQGGPGGFGFEGFPFGGGAGGGLGGFGDLDDLLSGLFGGGRGARARPRRGADSEGEIHISVRQAVEGAELDLPGRGIKVRVPAGVADGQRIRVAGKGERGMGGSGDLYLTIRVALPPGFAQEGEGANLSIDLPVTVGQAVLGARVTVPTPEGTTLTLKVPGGTQSGRRIRLKGKGLPQKGGRGDLYARVLVRVPTGDSPELKAAAEALEAFYETE